MFSLSCFRLLLFLVSLVPQSKCQCWRDGPCDGPEDPSFPGPWDKYIFAPKSRIVTPKTVLSFPDGKFISEYNEGVMILDKDTPELVFDFAQEVGGIVTVEFESTGGDGVLSLAFTEARDYISLESDSSNGNLTPDGHLSHKISSSGPSIYTVPDPKLRGGFRYLTLYQEDQDASPLKIKRVELEISFQPTWPNMRAYQGYFHSEDELLNRIWYSGAYTLQTNSVPSNTGRVDTYEVENSWQNDAFVGPGGTVLLDGAKRDRWVWIGDMGTAVPSAFVSTGDMSSTRHALQVMFDNIVSPIQTKAIGMLQQVRLTYIKRGNGLLPKAGPPYLAYDSDSE